MGAQFYHSQAMRSLLLLIFSLPLLHAFPADDSKGKLDEPNAPSPGFVSPGNHGANYGGHPGYGGNPGWGNPGLGGGVPGLGFGSDVLGVLPAVPSYQLERRPGTVKFKLVWVDEGDDDVDEDDPVVKHYEGKEIVVVKPSPWGAHGFGGGYGAGWGGNVGNPGGWGGVGLPNPGLGGYGNPGWNGGHPGGPGGPGGPGHPGGPGGPGGPGKNYGAKGGPKAG